MWGSSRRRPMKSPPGGGISARPKRASSGPASRNEARICSPSAGSIARASTSAPHSVSSFSPCQCTRTPSPSRISSIASTSRIRGTLRERELGVGQHRGGEDRQRTVLVAGGHDRAAERRAALNDELLHRWCQRASLHPDTPRPRFSNQTTAGTLRHEHTFCNLPCNAAQRFRAPQGQFAAAPRAAEGPAAEPFHPTPAAPYEHVFWRTPHPQASLRAVHRALDLARAALLLEPVARRRPRARRRARVPPAPTVPLRRSSVRAASRSGAGTSAALHHTAGPVGALQPRARRPSLTLGGRPATHAPRRGSAGTGVPANGVRRPAPRAAARPRTGGARAQVNRRRPTLPGPCEPSTIGAEGLNCSVRNGKRCFPLAIATGNGERPPRRSFKTAQRHGSGITKLSVKPSTH